MIVTSVGWADSRAEKRRQADALVAEALHREIYGLEQEREQLLREALALEPDHALAHWHLGHVGFRGRWVPVEDFDQVSRQRKRRERYERTRAEAPATAPGQLALANWCAEEGQGRLGVQTTTAFAFRRDLPCTSLLLRL